LRLFSFGGYGLALAALALVDFGAIECPPFDLLNCDAFAKRRLLFTEQNDKILKGIVDKSRDKARFFHRK